MRVLVACEFSGVVRDAFRAKGHDAWSCDLLPCAGDARWHMQMDVTDHLRSDFAMGHGWDLLIAHPPCTYLCSSGLHWNTRRPERAERTTEALAFVRFLMRAPVARIAIENPIGCISTRIRKPDQIIQPYNFGHDASKATCLWLKNLPKLQPTGHVEPRRAKGLLRWANQTDSGQNRLAPSADRWALRAETYQGIADAMAEQWSNLT